MKINSIHKIFAVVFLCLLTIACESAKKTNQNAKETVSKITMEKTTLGNSSVVKIDKKEISASYKNRNGEDTTGIKTTQAKQWNEINRLVGELDLNEISNWEAPTQARFYDGAKATTITIESGGQVYVSQSFDEGKPPAQLQKLYDYLESLVNQ